MEDPANFQFHLDAFTEPSAPGLALASFMCEQTSQTNHRTDLPAAGAEALARANLELKLLVEKQGAELARAHQQMREEMKERRKLELAFHESEERFMAFMNNSPTMAFIKDEKGRYVYGNKRWHSFFGHRHVPGAEWTDFHLYPKKTAARIRREDRQILATGKCSESVHNHRAEDGRFHPWLVIKFPILDPHGRPFIGGVGVDITERKRTEEALRHSERQILEISEREQQRIGQDLHDELCQYLAAIKFKNGLLTRDLRQNSPAEARQAAAIEDMLNTAIERAHGLARGLHPVQLEADGLSSALRELATNFTQVYRVNCVCQIRKPVLIHENTVAVHLYRIAQEAITNAIKHGKARKILVSLARKGGQITLFVEDNGVGFPQKPSPNNGMGLHIMNYRARMIGAGLTVAEAPCGGVLITCALPCPDPKLPDAKNRQTKQP